MKLILHVISSKKNYRLDTESVVVQYMYSITQLKVTQRETHTQEGIVMQSRLKGNLCQEYKHLVNITLG